MNYKLLYLDSLPLRSPNDGNAGYDLPIYGDVVIRPDQVVSVDVGLAIELPKGHVGIIFGRSGNAFKRRLLVIHNGVIDESYRGEISVLLYNISDDVIFLTSGDLIAQLVVFPVYTKSAEETDQLSDTARGNYGFGSTGLAGSILPAVREGLG